MSAKPDDPFPGPTPEVVNLDRARAAKLLQRDGKGIPIANVSNAIAILRHDPDLRDLFAYNSFTAEQCIRSAPPRPDAEAAFIAGPYPRAARDADVPLIQAHIQKFYLPKIRRQDIEDGIVAVAAMDTFHPVTDWLATLRHDGTERLDRWLVDAFGSPEDAYHSAIGAKLLIAAVRRVRQPGCKFDHMPVFEGAQGIGKSTAVARLFNPWFSDQVPPALESKDAAMSVQGIWCLEFAEIEQVVRAEVETIKAFLSRSTDRFRPPFGRRVQSFPRQSVCIGTTNSDEYLRDATGNRRFWPIKCAYADPQWVADTREQLWAEAAARESAGEVHWLAEEEQRASAIVEQAARLESDIWTDRIADALDSSFLPDVTIPALLSDPLFVPIERQTKREQMRVASILRSLGCKRWLDWENGRPIRKWKIPPKLTT